MGFFGDALGSIAHYGSFGILPKGDPFAGSPMAEMAPAPDRSEDTWAKEQGRDLYGRSGERSGYYQGMQESAQGRDLADAHRMDWGDYNQDRRLQYGSRDQQQRYAEELRRAAAGGGPSAAQAQFRSGLTESIQAQMGAAASTRGGSAALAQRSASMAASDMQAKAQLNAAALRAQEQQQAMQLYSGHLQQMRQQDLASQGMSMDQARAISENEYRQREINLKQRGLNDAMTQMYLGAELQNQGQMYDYLRGVQGNAAQEYAAWLGHNSQIQQTNSQTKSAWDKVWGLGSSVLQAMSNKTG